MHVTALFVHPLKSGAPQPVARLRLDARGAVGDRRWVCVDALGEQLTARTHHRLLHVRATLPVHDGAIVADAPLTLAAPDASPIVVPRPGADAARLDAQLWDDTVSLADAGDAAAAWCSAVLGVPCRLAYVDDAAHRPLQAKFAGPLSHTDRDVAAQDGAPLLLLGTASVDALDALLVQRGDEPVGVARFRPNVLLDTSEPHLEDTWAEVRIGDVTLGVGTPCPRCVLTTIDPVTLAQGVEPLRTLARARRDAAGKVPFGMNATHAAPGTITMGDVVAVRALR